MLDAILDISIDDLMDQLPLPEVAKDALAKRKGVFGDLLTIQEHFERGNWQGIETESAKIGLSVEEVSQSLHEALCWSNKAQYVV